MSRREDIKKRLKELNTEAVEENEREDWLLGYSEGKGNKNSRKGRERAAFAEARRCRDLEEYRLKEELKGLS